MPLNKDGLEAGQQVDFQTMMRVNRQRKVSNDDSKESKPAKRGRKAKESVYRSDEQPIQDSSESALSEEA